MSIIEKKFEGRRNKMDCIIHSVTINGNDVRYLLNDVNRLSAKGVKVLHKSYQGYHLQPIGEDIFIPELNKTYSCSTTDTLYRPQGTKTPFYVSEEDITSAIENLLNREKQTNFSRKQLENYAKWLDEEVFSTIDLQKKVILGYETYSYSNKKYVAWCSIRTQNSPFFSWLKNKEAKAKDKVSSLEYLKGGKRKKVISLDNLKLLVNEWTPNCKESSVNSMKELRELIDVLDMKKAEPKATKLVNVKIASDSIIPLTKIKDEFCAFHRWYFNTYSGMFSVPLEGRKKGIKIVDLQSLIQEWDPQTDYSLEQKKKMIERFGVPPKATKIARIVAIQPYDDKPIDDTTLENAFIKRYFSNVGKNQEQVVRYLLRGLQEKNEKVVFADQVAEACKEKNLVSMQEMSRLAYKKGFPIGQNRLFAFLRKNNYLLENNLPAQWAVDSGFFVSKEIVSNKTLYRRTFVTPVGQQRIINELMRAQLGLKIRHTR